MNCSWAGRQAVNAIELTGARFVCRIARLAQHPYARRVDDESPRRRRGRRGPRPLGGRHDEFERGLLDFGPPARRAVVGGVHVTVLRFGAALVGIGLGEVAHHGMRPPLRDKAGLPVIADQRCHIVAAADQRIEDSAADVSRRSGQEDAHRGRIS